MDTLELLKNMKTQRLELLRREKEMIVILHDAGMPYTLIADALEYSVPYVSKLGRENGATIRGKD